jgi:N-acetylneuraminate epimerase
MARTSTASGSSRILPVAAASGSALYLIGGAAFEEQDGKPTRRYLRDAWRYTAGAGWKRLADLPGPCAAAPSPAAVIGGKILLLGGDDGSLAGVALAEKHPGFSRSILTYDIAANSWTAGGEVPAARVTVPCVPWRGNFVIPSGELRPGVRSPEIWSLSGAQK